MNIAETILATGDAAAAAVFYRDTAMTYGELRQKVGRWAGGLRARGHAKGDRIGLWSENSPFFVTAYLATIRAGLVAVPFQTNLTRETFEKIVRVETIFQCSAALGGKIRGDAAGGTGLGSKDGRGRNAHAGD
jgi:acyl-CoA synthetase (AMP-forming)/AMP-acid ligase II